MSFQIKRKESVTKAVRRLCCERIDTALELLDKGNFYDAVHDVRREIKKLRAVLRLVRSGIGETAYGEVTDVLRAASGRLNAMRDAQVRVAALENLAKRSNGRISRQSLPKIQNALRENCRVEERKLGETLDSTKQFLLGARLQLGSLKVRPNSWKAIGPGLKKIYRRGRKALALAKRRPSPEHFHEWRKRVKDLSNQLRLVCPARPGKVKPRMEQLDHLGDLLGDDHDLFMLGQFVGKRLKQFVEKRPVEQVIAARQKELRSEALDLGTSFYTKKPNQFCRQVGKGWKSWRGN
ncbi:MAG TPA: CHAD domain-containing protein [Candidatus Acidoferrales bacterium]|jgi:CHAD domain-containing protein|nr:CHAD domain-containing protein [Candidatus Acidoferrales bacterium]